MAELTELKGGRDNNTELSSDLPTITAEINAYKKVAGEAIFEIGRRLKHVKENDLAHGEFMKWYEENGMTKDFVSKAIRISEELTDFETSRNIGLEALNLIATMPEEAREVEHEINGKKKKPEDMTVRELREVKRQLKAEKAQARLASNRNGTFQAWLRHIGIKKDKAYALIRRNDLIVGISDDKRQMIEELPTSLVEKVTKPSAESTTAKAEVLSGEITKLKQYEERVKELEQQAEAERKERERLERELDEVEPEVRYLN